jgi:8-oxo-dGTP pyrophosphatase MutT (NUDIX family)
MNKNSNVCNNCGKVGHQFNQCKLPIISYGVIAFSYFNNVLKFLMIRRKDSFGFIDFIRGKYNENNIYQIQNIIDEMSNQEKEKLLTSKFDSLLKEMWGDTQITHNNHHKNEVHGSCKKFDLLKNGLTNGDSVVTLNDMINKSTTSWDETEWEFPKGRKNFKEKDLECAVREFEEETGIKSDDINIVENVLPFEETFIGTNQKAYKHKYFLAYIENIDIELTKFQKSEVSCLEWKTFEECINSIRPYNLEKKKLIANINKVLEEYRLYS